MKRAAVEVPQPSGSRDETVALAPVPAVVALGKGRKRANRIVDGQALSRKKFKDLKQLD